MAAFTGKKEIILDGVKEFLKWILLSFLGFAYWFALLLVISVFLMNIWKIKFFDLLTIAIVLAVITSAFVGGRMLHKKFGKR